MPKSILPLPRFRPAEGFQLCLYPALCHASTFSSHVRPLGCTISGSSSESYTYPSSDLSFCGSLNSPVSRNVCLSARTRRCPPQSLRTTYCWGCLPMRQTTFPSGFLDLLLMSVLSTTKSGFIHPVSHLLRCLSLYGLENSIVVTWPLGVKMSNFCGDFGVSGTLIESSHHLA